MVLYRSPFSLILSVSRDGKETHRVWRKGAVERGKCSDGFSHTSVMSMIGFQFGNGGSDRSVPPSIIGGFRDLLLNSSYQGSFSESVRCLVLHVAAEVSALAQPNVLPRYLQTYGVQTSETFAGPGRLG